MKYSGLVKNSIAPRGAKNITIIKGDEVYCTIPVGALENNLGERVYRFGVVSDVHHDADNANPEATSDFANALNYFEKKEDCEFTTACGDMVYGQSWNSNGGREDFAEFKRNIDEISPTTPVFVARGNHDCGALSSLKNSYLNELHNIPDWDGDGECYDDDGDIAIRKYWKYVSFPHNIPSNLEMHFQNDSSAITDNYYFVKTLPSGKKDVFIFLSLQNNTFWSDTVAFGEENLNWLETVLEANKQNRCFIFMHLMLAHSKGYAGNFLNKYTNMDTWEGGSEHTKLVALGMKYPRTVWFSGHTHFKWRIQEGYEKWPADKLANVSQNKNGAWYVHIPSCAYPRVVSSNGSLMHEDYRSEGCIVDVYDDCINVRGIVFKNGEEYINQYSSIANFKLDIV